jgi:hypothetical protein
LGDMKASLMATGMVALPNPGDNGSLRQLASAVAERRDENSPAF